MSLILTNVELALETRRKSLVRNRLVRDAALAGARMAVKDAVAKYKTVKHRPVGPCNTYNCHGLTFGARRAWIESPNDIETILKEDDYAEVVVGHVMAGDIAIYRKDGIIEHSGIVVEKQGLVPKVLSKWATLHEAIHFAHEGPYSDMEVRYYRINDASSDQSAPA